MYPTFFDIFINSGQICIGFEVDKTREITETCPFLENGLHSSLLVKNF